VASVVQDPGKKERLEELKRKKRAAYLLPEPNDIKILAECCYLKDSENKRMVFLTDDAHFTEFSQEIKNSLDIEVDAIL
jgi:hypothetical protein